MFIHHNIKIYVKSEFKSWVTTKKIQTWNKKSSQGSGIRIKNTSGSTRSLTIPGDLWLATNFGHPVASQKLRQGQGKIPHSPVISKSLPVWNLRQDKDMQRCWACLCLPPFGRSWISSNPLWHAMLDPGIQHIHGQFGVAETWSLWLFRQVSSDRALWLFGFTKMSSAEQGLSKGGVHKQSDVGLCNYASLC